MMSEHSQGPGALFGAPQAIKTPVPLSTATFQSANYFGSPGDSPPGNPFSSIGMTQQPPPNFQFSGAGNADSAGMNSHWAQSTVHQNPLGRYPSVTSSENAASVPTSAHANSLEQSTVGESSIAENYHVNSRFALPLGPSIASAKPVTSDSQGVPPSQQEHSQLQDVPPLSVSANHYSIYGQFGAVQDSNVSTAGGVQSGQDGAPESSSLTWANNAGSIPPPSHIFLSTGAQGESVGSTPSISMASNRFSGVEGSDFLPSSSSQPFTQQEQSAQQVLHASGSSSSAPSTALLCTVHQEQGSVSQYSNFGVMHMQSLPALHARSPSLQGEYAHQPLPPPPTSTPESSFHRPSHLQRTATGQATAGLGTNELLSRRPFEKLSFGDREMQRSWGVEGTSTGSSPLSLEPRPGSSNSYPGDWQKQQQQPPLAPPTNTNANLERPHSSGDQYPTLSSTSSPLPSELLRPLSNASMNDQQTDRLFLERHESYASVPVHTTNATNADSQPSSLGSSSRTNAEYCPPIGEAVGSLLSPKRTGESTVTPDATALGRSAASSEGTNLSGVQRPLFQIGMPLEQLMPTPTGDSEQLALIEQQALLNENPLEGELPPSLSSSLNHSISSLLESQEEFNRMPSPCKILPPTPVGQLSPASSASHFQVIATTHYSAPPLQGDSNAVNAHQAFSQLHVGEGEQCAPPGSGVSIGSTQEGDVIKHQSPGMTLLPALQQEQLETPSSFAVPVASVQPSCPPFGNLSAHPSIPNLPIEQNSQGIEPATTVQVPPMASGVQHSSERVNGLPEKTADVPPSTQAAVQQPYLHPHPSHPANPNPPPSHTSNPHPPPFHTTNPNPPPSHTANPNPPPSHASNPNPPPSNAGNLNPPPSHPANPNSPPSHTANPNPPPSHTTNPNPPPSHTINPNPPPPHTANPNPPPSNTSNPNPPPSHPSFPNLTPSQTSNIPPSQAANSNPALSNASNPNPPPSHTSNPPPPHQTLSHTPLLPSQPSNPTTVPNAVYPPPPSTQPARYPSTPETATIASMSATATSPLTAAPATGLAVSQTQAASFFNPTTQPSLTDAMQIPGPGTIAQLPPQLPTAVPTMASNAIPPTGISQESATAPQAANPNPPPPTTGHPAPQLPQHSQQFPQPGVQQVQPTLQSQEATNPRTQPRSAVSIVPNIPTYSTNAAISVAQAAPSVVATTKFPQTLMQPLPQQPITNAQLQLAVAVPTPYTQGRPTNFQGPQTAQPTAQNYPLQPLPVVTQSAHMTQMPAQALPASSGAYLAQQPSYPVSVGGTATVPQATPGFPPSNVPPPSSQAATLQLQEGNTPEGGVPAPSNPAPMTLVQPQPQPQLQQPSQSQFQPLPQDAANTNVTLPSQQQQQQQQYHPPTLASHGAVPGHDAYIIGAGGPRERGRNYPDDRGQYDDRYRRHPEYDQERCDPYYPQERSRRPSYYDQGHDPYGRDYRQGLPGHTAHDYRDYRHDYPHEGLEHQSRYDYERYPEHYDYRARADPYYDRPMSYADNSRYYDPYVGRDPYDEFPVDPHYDSRYHYPQDSRRQHDYYDYEYPENRHYDQVPQEQYTDPQYAAAAQYEYQQAQQQPHQLPPTTDSTFSPEASAIYGNGRQDHFEVSEFVDSPSARLPGRHPQPMLYESNAYHDPAAYYDGQYAEGTYEQYAPWAPIPQPATPPPPSRQTPELFAHAHVRACFGFGGQLVTVLPNNPNARQPATVEICYLKNLVKDSSTHTFVEAVEASPGPLIPGDTPKGDVIRFTLKEAEKCRQKQQTEEDKQAAKNYEDEALLWDLLGLLCQQNGVALPVDISELLMKDRAVSDPMMVPTNTKDGNREEAMDALRKLLLAGRKKDALVLACDQALWGHGLMLASGMDEQSRIYVVNRFASSMMTMDPLNTFYTLLLGRIPSAVKSEGLHRAGDWRAHLAMILANRTSKLDNNCIVTLGDSLLTHGRLHAAHICYHFGYVPFGGYSSPEAKYCLLGVEHSHLKVGTYPEPAELWKMEVYEYAMSLSKQEFFLPSFQMYKFLHALKLAEVGFVEKALKYCEQISYSVAKGPQSYPSSFLLLLLELSAKLYHKASPIGLVETELTSWLIQLQHSVTEALSTDYTPSGQSSPSPAFSSVSQTYATNQQLQPPIIGLGQYLSVPGGTRASSADVSTAASSKESSVTNLQLAIPKVAQQGEMQVDGAGENAEAVPTEQSQFVTTHQGGTLEPSSNAGFQQAAFRSENAGVMTSGFVQQPLHSVAGVFYPPSSQFQGYDAMQGGYVQGSYQPLQQEQQGYGQQQQLAAVDTEATTAIVSTGGDTNVQFGHGGYPANYGTMAGVDTPQYPSSQYGGQQATAAATESEINQSGETQPAPGSYESHDSAFPQGSEMQPQTDTSAVFYWQQQPQQGPYGEQQLPSDQVGSAEFEAKGYGAETAESGDDHVTKNEQKVDNENETSGKTAAKKGMSLS